MITYINGILVEMEPGFIVVEASGIGYGINVPISSMPRLPRPGEMVKIYTHFHITEDSQKLYGFTTKAEKDLFEMLISVSGVGPKVGIGILSVLGPDDIRFAVLSEDDKALSRAPGLGPKTARKIILELKDKFSKSMLDGAGLGMIGGNVGLGDVGGKGSGKNSGMDFGKDSEKGASASKGTRKVASAIASDTSAVFSAREEAISALISLGYSPTDSLKAVSKVEINADLTSEDILRQALKSFA